jgi:hypothetical protein
LSWTGKANADVADLHSRGAERTIPFLVNTNYQANLDGLPEPLRSAVRDGNFMAARQDADFQVIPTQWIIEAQARWKPDGYKSFHMTAMAFDPAGGGADAAELAGGMAAGTPK